MTIICLNYFDTLYKVWSDKICSLLQTKYDNVCRTETRTEYKTEYDQKCETSYETKCEIMYETVYEEVCDTPPVDDEYGSPAAPVLDVKMTRNSNFYFSLVQSLKTLSILKNLDCTYIHFPKLNEARSQMRCSL